MIFSCKTIAKPVEDIIIKEKGSKFIGYAYPVQNEEEVKERLEELQSKYPDATHHCYAYRLGYEGENYRANDDGEPNGTAGLPIYNQLLSFDYTYILLVSIRYFGGTKLGVSGLIKTYKYSAEETLKLARPKTLIKKQKFMVKFPYTSQGNAMRTIEKFNGEILNQTYLEDCTLEIQIELKKSEAFIKSFAPFLDIEVEKIE